MNSTTIIAGLTPYKLWSWSATSTARTTSRAERHASKITGYDHTVHDLAPSAGTGLGVFQANSLVALSVSSLFIHALRWRPNKHIFTQMLLNKPH
jgi:hypothetical protein